MKDDNKMRGVVYFLWGVICAVLICLKVTHIINWSWGLILLPVYGPLAILILCAIIVATVITYKDMEDK